MIRAHLVVGKTRSKSVAPLRPATTELICQPCPQSLNTSSPLKLK